jgi:hypothetical protein
VSARSYRLIALILWKTLRWYVRRRRRARRLPMRWGIFSRGLLAGTTFTMLAVLVRRGAG